MSKNSVIEKTAKSKQKTNKAEQKIEFKKER